MERTIELTKENPEINFTFKYSFSHIILNRISVLFTDDSKNWVTMIQKSSAYLFIEYRDKTGKTISYPKTISALISPYHRKPVFDLEEIIPYENSKNMTSLGIYYNTLKIELKHGEHAETFEKIKVLLVFQDTPGVEITNQ